MTDQEEIQWMLDEIEEFLEGQSDVVDGPHGCRSNKAMTLLNEIKNIRQRLEIRASRKNGHSGNLPQSQEGS